MSAETLAILCFALCGIAAIITLYAMAQHYVIKHQAEVIDYLSRNAGFNNE